MYENRFKPPVEVGEELDVAIEAVGEKGDGIAKKNGFVLFVPNTKKGDNVRIRITKVLRKVGFAEVVGEAKAAPEGAEAPAEEGAEESAEETTEEAGDTENFGEEETTKETEEEPKETEEEPAEEEATEETEEDLEEEAEEEPKPKKRK